MVWQLFSFGVPWLPAIQVAQYTGCTTAAKPSIKVWYIHYCHALRSSLVPGPALGTKLPHWVDDVTYMMYFRWNEQMRLMKLTWRAAGQQVGCMHWPYSKHACK